MTAPAPYIRLPGTAREALAFYGNVFGSQVRLHTLEEFNRTDGPLDAITHGYLIDGPVTLFASDASGGEPSVRCEGLMLSLLGTSTPATMRSWFTQLAEGGRIVADLEDRPWGASDGHVVDKYGLHWLIGFPGGQAD